MHVLILRTRTRRPFTTRPAKNFFSPLCRWHPVDDFCSSQTHFLSSLGCRDTVNLEPCHEFLVTLRKRKHHDEGTSKGN
uniref:Uncharacterized protein n=1 Tax=Anguilla anguilla TaxID=7936 RepID=A0A0E9UZQ8_ANGAN